jgi:hypothetical protein
VAEEEGRVNDFAVVVVIEIMGEMMTAEVETAEIAIQPSAHPQVCLQSLLFRWLASPISSRLILMACQCFLPDSSSLVKLQLHSNPLPPDTARKGIATCFAISPLVFHLYRDGIMGRQVMAFLRNLLLDRYINELGWI